MNARKKKSSRPEPDRKPWFGFDRTNLAVLAAAVVSIVVGYVLLDRGSVTAAPILLVLGYVVLLPTGLLLGYGGAGEE